MRKFSKKIVSLVLTVAFCLSFTPVNAAMVVYAPEYTRVTAGVAYHAEAPVNGQIKDYVTWNTANDYAAVYGDFTCDVKYTGGSGSDLALFGAVYDSNWNLVKFLSTKKANGTASGTLSLTTDVASGQLYKTFLWQDETTAKVIETQPEAPVILYFYCDDPNTVTIGWYDLGGTYTVYKNDTLVASSGYTAKPSWTYIGKHSGIVYTDTSASNGDRYVVKNGTTASETLTADFTDGAYIEMGKYVKGRNMAYLRNDNAAWYHASVGEHGILGGSECDITTFKEFQASGTQQKWTNFFFKIDQDYASGSGNRLDVNIEYYERVIGSTKNMNLRYYPDSNPSSETDVTILSQVGNTNTWKSVNKTISGVTLAADTPNNDGEYQFRLLPPTGCAIRKITMTPNYDITTSLTVANKYSDGVELRWTTSGTMTSGITGYTVKRNGTIISENYTGTTYYDRGLTGNTNYTYTVTPKFNGHLTKAANTGTQSVTTDKVLHMVLPLDSSLNNTTYTSGGLSMWIKTDNRWDFGMTQVTTRGGKQCRATYCVNRSNPRKGDLWYNYYTYDSGADRRASCMSFTVDNSWMSSDRKNVTIEFDYYDDPDSWFRQGHYIQVDYLKYNNGGTPTKTTVYPISLDVDSTRSWKDTKITLADAQFNHAAGVINTYEASSTFDFQIYVGTNRGGFASTYVKLYTSMPAYSEVSADGTVLYGDLYLNSKYEYGSTISYDQNILLSGTAGRSAQSGSHYMFNQELTSYNGGDPSWRRWQNSWWYNIPDDIVYGTSYSAVDVVVEYYCPTSTNLRIMARDTADGESTAKQISPTITGSWQCELMRITPLTLSSTNSKQYKFSNGQRSGDFRMNFESAQGYIRKVSVYKYDYNF